MEFLNVVAIVVAGLMVGSELAVAAFVHPTLNRLPGTDGTCFTAGVLHSSPWPSRF